MIKKCYWYKINLNGKDIGDGVTRVWFWQDALVAHKRAVKHVSEITEADCFLFSCFKRIK